MRYCCAYGNIPTSNRTTIDPRHSISISDSKLDPNRHAFIFERITLLLRLLVIGLAAGLILLFIFSALLRLRYPFPLEQLEGTMALGVARVAHGLPLYVRPNFTFIPYMYSPAYFYVAAFVSRAIGTGLFTLRLVSFLSALGCFAVISALIFTETRSRFAALAGAGLYAAAYPVTHNWFDLGRVDSLYVFLILLALFATRKLHPMLAALAWTLAFFAKQTIAPVAILMLCFDWKTGVPASIRLRRVMTGLATFLVCAFGGSLLLERATQGWFGFYAFTVPMANRDMRLHPALFFPSMALFAPFGIALVVIAAALLLTRVHGKSIGGRFYVAAGGSLVALCWFLTAHASASFNTPMPVDAMLAVGFGIALARLLAWLPTSSPMQAHLGGVLLLLAVLAQLASQLYSPRLTVPSSTVRVSQQQFVDWLQTLPGDILVPSHAYEAMLAGRSTHVDEIALHDALRPGVPSIYRPVVAQIHQAIDQEKFSALVLDRNPASEEQFATWLPADWRAHYPVLALVPGEAPAHAFISQARYVLLPCKALPYATASGLRLIQSSSAAAASPCPGNQPR